MSLIDWFANRQKTLPKLQDQPDREIANGLWTKCESCGVLAYSKDLKENQMVCIECSHHIRINSNTRISQLIDAGTWLPIDVNLSSCDPLNFRDKKLYSDRYKEYQDKTGLTDAVQTGLGKLNGIHIALGVMDFSFMGGSMGSVVGEKLTRLIERATQDRIPLIIVCASGGARMQEGMLSLMQMAKTSAALNLHRDQHLLYISLLTHPTTGGVTASFAMLGDIILAEPKAMVAFAGERVMSPTPREKLPENFQTSEYLLEHGFVDAIVPRTKLKTTLERLILLHQPVSETLSKS